MSKCKWCKCKCSNPFSECGNCEEVRSTVANNEKLVRKVLNSLWTGGKPKIGDKVIYNDHVWLVVNKSSWENKLYIFDLYNTKHGLNELVDINKLNILGE